MAETFGALAPVFLLIALGAALRTRGVPEAGFWPGAERLVYMLLLPALLFRTTARADLLALDVLPLVSALMLAILGTAGGALLVARALRLSRPAQSSVFQGAIRTNAYVALAGAAALYGEAGLVPMGLVVFVVITTVNVLSVIAVTWLGRRGADASALIGAVLKNPLIIACLAGFACGAAGLELPAVVLATIEVLANAALPLGLLCVGAGLELGRLLSDRRAMMATIGLKLLAMPALTALTCHLFGIEGLTAACAILFNAVPTSASSYVLARELGGDAPLMAVLITITTAAAAISMPLVLSLLT